MKKIFIAIFLSSIFSESNAGDCSKFEYQELKEMTVGQLTKELCTDKREFKLNKQLYDIHKSMAKSWEKVNSSNSSDSWDNAINADAKLKICKNEIERISRILAQKNVGESELENLCAETN